MPVLKTYPTIIGNMVSTAEAESDLTDFNPGSVNRTILEAAALQDADQYVQIATIEDAFSIDSAVGDDLDRRAEDYAGSVEPRLEATQAFGTVRVGDSRVTKKKSSTLAVALTTGSTTVQVTFDAGVLFSDFPAAGVLIIGRATEDEEKLTYSSKSGSNVFNLVGNPTLAHSIGVTAILSQQGANQSVPDLSVVLVPATATSDKIEYETIGDGVLYDGDATVDITARSKLPGLNKNVNDGFIITFQSKPFPNATVTNPASMAGGRDRENDDQFRARIRDTVSTLTNGTRPAIESAAAKVQLSTGQRVVSAQLIEPIVPGDESVLFIDDGTGFVPSTTPVRGVEILIQKADTGQSRTKLLNFPVLNDSLRLFRSVQSGVQPVGVPTITVSGNTLTDSTKTFPASLISVASSHILVDSNRQVWIVTGADGSNTVTLSGAPARPIAGENYFIVDIRATAKLPPGSFVIDETTGNIQFIGLTLSPGGVNPGEGVVAVNENYPLTTGDAAYQYYGGLVQEVQRVMNGVPSDPFNYPGIKGAGARVRVTTPQVVNVTISVGISAPAGLSEDTIATSVKNAIVTYVNSLGIGDNVIVAEIIRIAQESGAADTRMVSPTSNIILLEGQLARTSLSLVTVS